MAIPHKCPVCDGWGFREITKKEGTSCEVKRVVCDACKGTGIVWEPQKTEEPTPYKYETFTCCDSDNISEDNISFYVVNETDSTLSRIE